MLLLKVKVIPKFECKLYNYNKILECTNIKNLNYYFYYQLYYYIIVYIKILRTIV